MVSVTIKLNCPRLNKRTPHTEDHSFTDNRWRTCQTANTARWHGRSSDWATCWTEWRHTVRNPVSYNEQLLMVRMDVLPLSSGCNSPRSSSRWILNTESAIPSETSAIPTSRLHITSNPKSWFLLTWRRSVSEVLSLQKCSTILKLRAGFQLSPYSGSPSLFTHKVIMLWAKIGYTLFTRCVHVLRSPNLLFI